MSAPSERARSEPRRRMWWPAYAALVLVTASFAAWSTATVLEVSELRDEVAANVEHVSALQQIERDLATGADPNREPLLGRRAQVATRLASSRPELVTLEPIEMLARRGSTPREIVTAIDTLSSALRDDNARISRRLARHWDSVGIVVVVCLILAAGVLILLEILRRRARSLASTSAELARQLRRRRAMVEELDQSRQRFALAAAAARDGVWDWDLVDGVIWMSARCAELLDLPPENGDRQPAQWFDRIHPDDRARVQAAIDAHVSGETEGVDVEYRVLTPDGRVRWLATRALAQRDDGEVAHRIAGSHSDVTRSREMERLKDEFVAAVGHELRTPLTAILGALALTKDGRAGELTPEAERLLDLAQRNGRRLLTLVNDIMDLQRLAARRVEFKLEPLDLVSLCQRTLDECVGLASPAEVQLQFAPDAPAAEVVGDPARLAQVVMNLVGNAVKFSPAGETVSLRVSTRGPHARVEVDDRGPGIAPDDVPRIFERFVKLDRAGPSRPGAGLGLAISRAIVEAHGGRIGVESRPGEGSTFYFELPLSVRRRAVT